MTINVSFQAEHKRNSRFLSEVKTSKELIIMLRSDIHTIKHSKKSFWWDNTRNNHLFMFPFLH